MSRKSVSVTYSRVTPESAEDGDTSESGHLETLPIALDEYDRENGLTVVDLVVTLLKDSGARNPSSSAFHKGVWYSTDYEVISYSSGEEEEKSYHLKGFSEDEEREIYKQVAGR